MVMSIIFSDYKNIQTKINALVILNLSLIIVIICSCKTKLYKDRKDQNNYQFSAIYNDKYSLSLVAHITQKNYFQFMLCPKESPSPDSFLCFNIFRDIDHQDVLFEFTPLSELKSKIDNLNSDEQHLLDDVSKHNIVALQNYANTSNTSYTTTFMPAIAGLIFTRSNIFKTSNPQAITSESIQLKFSANISQKHYLAAEARYLKRQKQIANPTDHTKFLKAMKRDIELTAQNYENSIKKLKKQHGDIPSPILLEINQKLSDDIFTINSRYLDLTKKIKLLWIDKTSLLNNTILSKSITILSKLVTNENAYMSGANNVQALVKEQFDNTYKKNLSQLDKDFITNKANIKTTEYSTLRQRQLKLLKLDYNSKRTDLMYKYHVIIDKSYHQTKPGPLTLMRKSLADIAKYNEDRFLKSINLKPKHMLNNVNVKTSLVDGTARKSSRLIDNIQRQIPNKLVVGMLVIASASYVLTSIKSIFARPFSAVEENDDNIDAISSINSHQSKNAAISIARNQTFQLVVDNLDKIITLDPNNSARIQNIDQIIIGLGKILKANYSISEHSFDALYYYCLPSKEQNSLTTDKIMLANSQVATFDETSVICRKIENTQYIE